MNTRWTIVALLLGSGVAIAADADQELRFAQALGARGLTVMADQVLDKLIASGGAEGKRAGEYGKALIQKQLASRARGLFLFDLDEGRPPRVSREEVLRLYAEAKPKIEAYVSGRSEAGEAAFLLAELLMEYAEFLTGASYPDEMVAERKKLVDENKDAAAKLFEVAVANFERVYDEGRKALPKDDSPDPTSPLYIRTTQADLYRSVAKFRWALIYPGGVQFTHKMDTAELELDEHYNRHFKELSGAYAVIYLGRGNYEKALRTGEGDAGEVALNYFATLFREVTEDPTVPDTMDVIGEAFYWYCKTANALALKEGALKKAQPVYLENSIKAGTTLKQTLKHGGRRPWALLALLEVGNAHAARGNFQAAVEIAGEVLASARTEGDRRATKRATDKLTQWVGSVAGASVLDPGLLYQIGESLNAQGRLANAITFYEKTVGACRTEEQRERYGHSARLRIAQAYRRDSRFLAGAEVGWQLVSDYLQSKASEESSFHTTASEACNTARACFKAIADATKRPADDQRYREVTETFRAKFPDHPDNSDAAFSNALELINRGKLQEAAESLKDINPNSPNYWRAQRSVPTCYQKLAREQPEKAAEWSEKFLASSQELAKTAAARGDDPAAVKSRQYGRLFTVIALADLARWPEALTEVDKYLADYPDDFLYRGLELDVKIHGHLAAGEIEKAESALALLKTKQPGADSLIRRNNQDVFDALRKAYKEREPGPVRVDMAARAAKLWGERMEGESNPSAAYSWLLGDVLRDAQQWQEAGEAFETAASKADDPNVKSAWTLQAAEMRFEAILHDPRMPGPEKQKVLALTRENYTDVLIPEKAQQEPLLKVLSNYAAWPSKEMWEKIKRRPDALLTAAKVFKESSPAGLDGRWIGIRLINHLHSFTKPNKDPSNDKLDEFIPLWWNGTELMLELYLQIAETGTGQMATTAAQSGAAFSSKILFENPNADGPDRLTRLKQLDASLKARVGGR